MANIDKIDKIKKVKGAEKAAKPVAFEEELQRVGPNKERFDKLMVDKPDKIQPEQKLEGSSKRSPIEELRDISSSSTKPTRVTPPELIAQTQEAINKLEDIKGRLQAPEVQVKESLTPLLDSKLTHINENIRAALTKTGAEYAAPTLPIAPSQNPVMRFLGFLTDGQYKLQTLAAEVERMHLRKEDINPAALLAVQLKVGLITQELEFFSSLLNKALESTKTIMNVQV